MRWNKVLRHWEGLARHEEVAALAQGTRRLGAACVGSGQCASPATVAATCAVSVDDGRPFRKQRRQNRQQERRRGGLVIARIGYDFFRASLRLFIALWPLWLFWFAWRELLLTFHGGRDPGYLLAYRAWPSVALAGPVAVMVAALVAYPPFLSSLPSRARSAHNEGKEFAPVRARPLGLARGGDRRAVRVVRGEMSKSSRPFSQYVARLWRAPLFFPVLKASDFAAG